MPLVVLAVYLLGMLFVVKGIEKLISRLDERNTDADAHHYFWRLWLAIARWLTIWSCLCGVGYTVGVERPSQGVDYLIGFVAAFAYALISGAIFGFLPALFGAMYTDKGEAAMIKASAGAFMVQWLLVVSTAAALVWSNWKT